MSFSEKTIWSPELLGVSLIVAGLLLSSSFIKPYLYYLIAPAPLEANYAITGGSNRIIVPSIKLNERLYPNLSQLDYGIALYSKDRAPDSKGNVVLKGHNFGHTPLFSLLYLVRKNDEVVLHYGGKLYAYKVRTRRVVKPEQEERFTRPTNDERLTMVTCYPPTSTLMRLVVIAKPKRE